MRKSSRHKIGTGHRLTRKRTEPATERFNATSEGSSEFSQSSSHFEEPKLEIPSWSYDYLNYTPDILDPPEDSISVIYTNRYDPMVAHKTISEWYKYRDKITLPRMEGKCSQMRMNMEADSHQRKRWELVLKSYLEELEAMKNKTFNDYLQAVRAVLDQYYVKFVHDRVINLSRKSTNHGRSQESQVEMDKLVSLFCSFAKEFYPISVEKKMTNANSCPSCGADTRTECEEIDGIQFCKCGREIYKCTRSVNSRKEEGDTAMIMDSYEGKKNFVDIFDRKQGLNYVNIPDSLFEDLNQYFVTKNMHHLLPSQVLSKPVSSLGFKPGTSLKTMELALKSSGNSEYFKHIDYICQEYWGWVLPDWSSYRERVMMDYDEFMRYFEELKGDRSSCVNGEFLLCRLLKKNGAHCHLSQFKTVEIESTLPKLEALFQRVATHLGWESGSSIL